MECILTINDREFHVDCSPGEKLLDTLRRLGFYSVKKGCGTGNCGACVVLMDGKPVNSCLIYTISVQKSDIKTVEGINADYIQQSLVETGGVQCGFCTPGKVISTYALLEENPEPSEREIKNALDGNLCRCTGYKKIYEGIKLAISRKPSSV